MKLEWMLLANYAEVNNNLLYIQGGGWDTITVGSPYQGPPPPPGVTVFTLLQGMLVIRLNFHPMEAGRDHSFDLRFMDEDGNELDAKANGSVRVDRVPGLPPGWMINVQLPIPLVGVAIPKPGLYHIGLQVNRQHVGDRPFRVLKGY